MMRSQKSHIIALIGNPNSGKTTLFNLLTGSRQRVGNWPGVTVEQKRGYFGSAACAMEVVDLPGCYSCTLESDGQALDEHIACEYLLSNEAQVILNIVDASNLERHLYLTLQLLERGYPVILALNLMDVAEKQGIHIDVALLSKRLNCPVIPLSALKGQGVEYLKKAIIQYVGTNLQESNIIQSSSFCLGELDDDILKAKTRYEMISNIVKATITRKPRKSIAWDQKIDAIILNRFLGIPLFLLSMYCMFLFAIHMAGIFQDFFDIASNAVFVIGMQQWLNGLDFPFWLSNFISAGLGRGINTTVSFIPVIASVFLCLSFLEASGYMARAAFVMDRLMQVIGLPGKSFVPLIIGFGCNVPAILSARTLENYRERILTILMSPFMSCGARLAIYALFVSAFFPTGGQNIIFGLYLIGILVALMTGFILRKIFFSGEQSSLVMELPPYRWPSFRILWQTTWHRLRQFILKAGALIIPLCAILGTIEGVKIGEDGLIAHIGRTLTPIFAPMGIKEENWQASVGLLTGVLAKEVVVGTLNTLYAQEIGVNEATKTLSVANELKMAVKSIPENALRLSQKLKNPFSPMTGDEEEIRVSQSVLGIMVAKFASTKAAIAYLLFVLLYFPCVSVVAIIARELNKAWAFFSIAWTTGIAYSVAVLFYQTAIIFENPLSSFSWIIGISFMLISVLWGLKKWAQKKILRRRMVPTRILVTHF